MNILSSFAARPSFTDAIFSDGTRPPGYRVGGSCGDDTGSGDDVCRVSASLRGSAGTDATLATSSIESSVRIACVLDEDEDGAATNDDGDDGDNEVVDGSCCGRCTTICALLGGLGMGTVTVVVDNDLDPVIGKMSSPK